MNLSQLRVLVFSFVFFVLIVIVFVDVEFFNWFDFVLVEGEGIELFFFLGIEVLGLFECDEGMFDEDYVWEIVYIFVYCDFQFDGVKLNS